LVPLFMRAFYALQDVKTPIIITVFAELLSITLAFALKGPFGVAGLAIAFSIAAIVQISLLIFFLRKRQGPLGEGEFALSALKVTAATFALSIVAYPIRQLVGTLYPLRTFLQVFMQAALSVVGGVTAFVVVAWLLKSPEIEEMAHTIKRRLWRKATVTEGLEEAKETR
jgi:putative peptidoglycan lipid II flippase